MKDESKGQLVFFYILLKRNKGKISVLIYWKPTDTTNTYTNTLTIKQVARKVLFPPSLIGHIPLSQIIIAYTKNTQE